MHPLVALAFAPQLLCLTQKFGPFGFDFAPLLFLKLPVGKVLVALLQRPKGKNQSFKVF
jgi:hypothetical protein